MEPRGPFLSVLLFCFSLATASAGADTVASLLAQKRFGEALKAADSLLTSHPQDPLVWTARGLALAGLGRIQDGLASFDRALKIQPSLVPALKAASETAYRARDRRAGSYLQKLLRVEPASEPAHAMAAVLAFEARDCQTAVIHFIKSRSQVLANAVAASQFGDCLLQLGRPEEAVRIFEQQLAQGRPQPPYLRYNLAVAQLQAGTPEEAITTLATFVESADSDALNLLAAAQAAAGRTEAALATLRRAVAVAPNDERNYLDLASLCQKSGASGLAVEFLDAGLRRLPQSARLFAMRGVLRAQLGELEKAEADFERAGLVEPDQTYASIGLSVLFSETGRAEGATRVLRQKLARSPDDPTLNCVLADALLREGVQPGQPEFAEARQALQRAIRVRPNFARAHVALGKLCLREGNAAEAISELNLALRLDPASRPALSQLSVALRRAGRPKEAAEAAERLRRQYERDLEAETARQRVLLTR